MEIHGQFARIRIFRIVKILASLSGRAGGQKTIWEKTLSFSKGIQNVILVLMVMEPEAIRIAGRVFPAVPFLTRMSIWNLMTAGRTGETVYLIMNTRQPDIPWGFV